MGRKDKVTVQDIADALGVSRTTVSKALNGSAGMPPKTVARILAKAKEMNYKQFAYLPLPEEKEPVSKARGAFALLAHVLPARFHIASALMVSLEQEISRYGYSLTIHILSDEDIRTCSLPSNLYLEAIDALICVELFDEAYSRMLCSLDKPVLFSDAACTLPICRLHADILLMENHQSVRHMLQTVIQDTGITRLGFLGDYTHCLSFRERYEGFLAALSAEGLPLLEDCCITDPDCYFMTEGWLSKRLLQQTVFPQLFFCANDLIALQTMSALHDMGMEIPKDIMICGFDDTLAVNSVSPSLTTVRTPSTELGIMAAQLLLRRIENPQVPPSTTYLNTSVQFRQSTRRLPPNDSCQPEAFVS